MPVPSRTSDPGSGRLLTETVTPAGLVVLNVCRSERRSELAAMFATTSESPSPVVVRFSRSLSRTANENASGAPGSTLVVR